MGKNVYVWDRFVRLFHWSLVSLFIFSFITGELEHGSHVYSGYAIVVLLFMRVIWGFIGSPYARFRQFVYSPATVIDYAKQYFSPQPRHYLGHNPLGGVMVVALLLGLLVTGYSGLKLYAVEHGKGPLAANVETNLSETSSAQNDIGGDHGLQSAQEDSALKSEAVEFWEKAHPISVTVMLVLIVLHISGVVLSSRTHKESLIRAMFTGYKEKKEDSL